jgi:hypothetical protein
VKKRSNQTHESTTDPDALLARKGNGKEAKLSYTANLLTENRHGLIVNTEVFQANGTAERDAALVMLEQIPGTGRVTVGADKGYDTRDFVAECRHLNVTPQVAQNVRRPGGSAIDKRTTRHDGYRVSQVKRKARRGMLRMAEDRGVAAQTAASRHLQGRLGLHLCGCRLQPVRMRNLARLRVQSA